MRSQMQRLLRRLVIYHQEAVELSHGNVGYGGVYLHSMAHVHEMASNKKPSFARMNNHHGLCDACTNLQ